MILASLLVSCFALSSVVEARGGTGGSGGGDGRGGRSDGSGIGSNQGFGRSGDGGYGESRSDQGRDFRNNKERSQRDRVGGDLLNEGLRTPK